VEIIGTKYGNTGIYLVAAVSGLTDVDAITLSLSSLNIPIHTAAVGISIAAVSNSLVKLSIVWLFSRKELALLMTKFFAALLFVFLVSLAATYFIAS
jgi:uncharacterized membrane protein (DUF4010 family)